MTKYVLATVYIHRNIRWLYPMSVGRIRIISKNDFEYAHSEEKKRGFFLKKKDFALHKEATKGDQLFTFEKYDNWI